MAGEAIPREGIIDRFRRGFSQDFRSKEQAIAGQQIQNDQTRLANAIQQLQIIAGTDPNNKTANISAIQAFKRLGIPVKEGADFSPFLDKFRAGSKGKPFTLGPGQKRFTGEGEQVAKVPLKPTTPKQSSSVIIDPRDPNKAIRVRNTFDPQGNLINQQFIGEATLAERIGGVAAEGLQKSTQTKLEKDIIDLQTTLTELDAIDEQFDENFFTFRGKAGAALTAFFEKAEIPVGKARQEFLSKKTKFFADSKRVFLKFRKFITGVAGGIEEFREIAKATIDPEKDSPTQFSAKMESMRDNAKRTQNVLLAIRNSGLDPKNQAIRKHIFRGLSLESIPIDVPGDVTLETLSQQQVPSRENLTPADLENLTLEQLRGLQ